MRQPSDHAVVQVQAVGRRIAELRAGHGWTQDAFAVQLDVSVDYVQRIERGTNLTIRSLVCIATALGVNAIDLFAAPTATERRAGRPRAARRTDNSASNRG